MKKDIIVRQYAHADKFVNPIIENPGKVTGIHLLAHGGSIQGDALEQYHGIAEKTRRAGLDVLPGCRLLPFGEYDNPLMWEQAADIVRAIGLQATRGLFVFDGENYASSGAESRVEIGLMRELQKPLVEALREMRLQVGWYPASVEDTAMMALLGEVGGEAWGEASFGSSVYDVHDFLRRDLKKLGVYNKQEEIRNILPDVVYRSGFLDRAIREGILEEDFNLPLNSWIFDFTRAASIVTGQAERYSWGTPTWHTGEELSSLNSGIQNVFQFQPLAQDPSPGDFKGEGRLALKWNRASAGHGANDPVKPLYLVEGYEYRGLWHAEAQELSNLDEASISFEVTLPDDVSGSFPLANSWWVHNCCQVWSVSVQEGQVKLSIGMGTRNAGYTFGQVMNVDYAEAIPGEKIHVVFGYDATNIYLPGREPIPLPLGKETNNIRAAIFVGYANQILEGISERTHYAREGTIWSNQLVRWNRVLSPEEMEEAKIGRYPWGL